MVVILHLKHDW